MRAPPTHLVQGRPRTSPSVGLHGQSVRTSQNRLGQGPGRGQGPGQGPRGGPGGGARVPGPPPQAAQGTAGTQRGMLGLGLSFWGGGAAGTGAHDRASGGAGGPTSSTGSRAPLIAQGTTGRSHRAAAPRPEPSDDADSQGSGGSWSGYSSEEALRDRSSWGTSAESVRGRGGGPAGRGGGGGGRRGGRSGATQVRCDQGGVLRC